MRFLGFTTQPREGDQFRRVQLSAHNGPRAPW